MNINGRPETSQLLETLLTTNSLAEAIERSANVLGNPLAIFDASYQVVASSKRSAPDEAWREGINRGRWNYEFVARLNRILAERGERDLGEQSPAIRPERSSRSASPDHSDHSVHSAHPDHSANSNRTARTGLTGHSGHSGRHNHLMRKPAILTDLSERRRRVEGLVLDDTLLGFVVILEHETRLEDVDEQDYQLVRKVLAKAVSMERAAHFHSNARSTEALLLDILGGRFSDRLLLMERLRGSGMEEAKNFSLFTVSLSGYLPDNLREEALKKKLESIFRLCWSVSEHNHIVILAAHTGQPEQRAAAMQTFTSLLRQHQLLAGQSAVFSDLLQLPRHHRQALRALEISRELSGSPFIRPDSVIFPYEDYKIIDLISGLGAEELSGYCNSAVRSMFEHDRAQGTEYARTLFHYLNSGRSIHTAAKGLYVHHNTVYYRLTKMKDLFGLDFSNEYQNMQYYLSCLMLLYFWERHRA
ncbi:helix-turn-helix domain-containing protein [Desulfovibrio sp. OttesenSCG-928-C06]|nr:helix-turn-helix domain-containing protein [Desulfovibrio sp. OttesenSCG-928-C06]